MEAITVYKIHTGKTFDTLEKARKELNEIHGNALLELSKKVMHLNDYKETTEEFENNWEYYYNLLGQMKRCDEDKEVLMNDDDEEYFDDDDNTVSRKEWIMLSHRYFDDEEWYSDM